jgi:hypothetical protein
VIRLAGVPVVGVIMAANQRAADGRPPFSPDEVAALAGLEPLELRVEHELRFCPSGVIGAGAARAYRFVPDPPHTVALLDVQDPSVMAAVERGQLWGLSLGPGCAEVSLTSDPAYTGCKVLGWGEAALEMWDAYDRETVTA